MLRRSLTGALVVAALVCLVQNAQGGGPCHGRSCCDFFFGGYGPGPFGHGYFRYPGDFPYGYVYGAWGFGCNACNRGGRSHGCLLGSTDSPDTSALVSDTPATVDDVQSDGNRILFTVTVPRNARVWINGLETKRTGERREFSCKGLDPNGQYDFVVRCVFVRDGETTSEEQTIRLTAGQTDTIAMGVAPDEHAPQLASSTKR